MQDPQLHGSQGCRLPQICGAVSLSGVTWFSLSLRQKWNPKLPFSPQILQLGLLHQS